ncbi:MAG: hypothetical protein V4447_11285 [Pseudomonadota bacterium]
MPHVYLDIKLRIKLEQLFPHSQRIVAEKLLEAQCGTDLPLIAEQGIDGINRIRCAVLKISEGSLEKLHAAVQIANIDWRDVLVAADFANDALAHISWLECKS